MADKRQARFGFHKLIVRNLDKQAAFYREVMGYDECGGYSGEFNGRPMREAIFHKTNGEVELVLLAYDDDGATGDADSVVSAFFTSDLDGLNNRVIAAGGSVVKPIRSFQIGGQPSRLAYYKDPEGFVIQVFEDTSSS